MPKVVDQTQIFNAVIELLIKKGYAGTTTKEIAQVAGINEVTLFRRYHSKAQLVIQAVENLANHEMMGDSIQFTGDLEA
ncbi:MAG: helix-turn-helix domain-containing protein, partial [Chloroflexota bacterium]